ncbi:MULTISPECIES: hypothetical protein [unclassified Bradyrhizobium]|uniref:hypothetical protein n=1 Tax=unclassified Bradyrhizobium TaxID=2631580 RepID=UPI002FF18C9B
MDKNNKRRHQPMATKDGFPPDRSPLFLSEHTEKIAQPDIGKALNRAAISSRILKASIWAVTATAIGIAILSVGDPVALVENVTATWVEKPALQSDVDSSAPAVQSIAGTQDSPPKTSDVSARDEIAAASEPADQNQTVTGQPPAESLLKEFEAWAAREDARAQEDTRAQVVPVQLAQAAPVQVAQDAPVQAQPTKKHRRARSVHNARAEIRSQRRPRAKVREEQNAPVQIAPVPDPRAQEQAVQNAQTPSLLQSLGLR